MAASVTGTAYVELTANSAKVPVDMPDAGNGFMGVLVIDEAAGTNYEGGAEAIIDALAVDLLDFRVSANDDSVTYPWGLMQFSQVPGSRKLIIGFRVPSGDPLLAASDATYRLWYGGTGGTSQDKAATTPTADGWTSYWPIEDVTDIEDWSDNANDCTNQGAADGPGQVGNGGVMVSGESDWIEIPASTDYDYTTNFAFACWLKYDTSLAWPIIWRRRYNSEFPIDIKFGNNTHKVEFAILAGAVHTILGLAHPENDGQWQHVVCTYDASLGSANMKIILNGVQEAQGDETDAITVADRIGGLGSNPYPTGTMDDVQLHDPARSVNWWLTYFNMTSDPDGFWTVGPLEGGGIIVPRHYNAGYNAGFNRGVN